jgi:parvulin-like peptidyl-prolyl isomerase
MNMKGLLNIIVLSLVFTAMAAAQTDLQPAAIVRLTKSEPITVKQFRMEVEKMEKQAGRSLNATERRQILDVMINERLAMQAAERDRVTVSENELNQQVQQLRSQMAQSLGRQPTDPEFAAAIKNETGLDLPAFRDQLRRQYVVQKYLLSKKQNLIQSVQAPTDADILNLYNLSRAQFVRPETVRFSMIQVAYGETPADKAKARGLADQLVREIGSNPAKFDEAVIRAQGAGSGYQGGDGGYLPRNIQAQQVVGAEFMTVAFSLKQGEVSNLIENKEGYQIIKITETYEQRNLELNDIFQLGTRVTVRDYISNSLLQQRQQAAVEKASQELVSELRTGNPFQIFENNLTW